jgi:hypothetical protein
MTFLKKNRPHSFSTKNIYEPRPSKGKKKEIKKFFFFYFNNTKKMCFFNLQKETLCKWLQATQAFDNQDYESSLNSFLARHFLNLERMTLIETIL